jgi:hypothetical protein
MATEQRTGFRLPWAAEPKADDARGEAEWPQLDPEIAVQAALEAVEAIDQAAVPSDVVPAEDPEPSTEASSIEDTVTQDIGAATIDRSSLTWPSAPEAMAAAEAVAATEETVVDGSSSEPQDEAVVEPMADGSFTTDATGTASSDEDEALPVDPQEAASLDTAPEAGDTVGDPIDGDRDEVGAVNEYDIAAPEPSVPEKARRDNPLVAGLVRAMRDAAQAAREESLAKFADEAKGRIEAINAASADDAAAIRRQADQDIAAIRDWSKAEMARIREETDEKIAERRRNLELEVEDHAALLEHRIEHVQAAVSAFEAQMESFYSALLAEEDPTRLAGFAEQLPEPPSLDESTAEDWSPATGLDADNAAAAEAAALEDLGSEAAALSDETDEGDASAAAHDPWSTDGSDADTEAAPEPAPESLDAHVVERLAAFASPVPGAEGGSVESTTSRVAVVGLISVASIAGFKRALGRSPGVTGVTVASGPNGDFIFTVHHGLTTDLVAVIGGLEGFATTVNQDEDGNLAVSASESAPAG